MPDDLRVLYGRDVVEFTSGKPDEWIRASWTYCLEDCQ